MGQLVTARTKRSVHGTLAAARLAADARPDGAPGGPPADDGSTKAILRVIGSSPKQKTASRSPAPRPAREQHPLPRPAGPGDGYFAAPPLGRGPVPVRAR